MVLNQTMLQVLPKLTASLAIIASAGENFLRCRKQSEFEVSEIERAESDLAAVRKMVARGLSELTKASDAIAAINLSELEQRLSDRGLLGAQWSQNELLYQFRHNGAFGALRHIDELAERTLEDALRLKQLKLTDQADNLTGSNIGQTCLMELNTVMEANRLIIDAVRMARGEQSLAELYSSLQPDEQRATA
jgi:hypothetical protein